MLAAVIAFISALALAGVAAWFSITGLMAIFAALPLSVAIMAGVLEVAKLVTASILYRNWSTIPTMLRVYLTSAVVVLMLITSLGIFGYLSKAHLDQNAPVSNSVAKIERLEQRIQREERAIVDAETIIAQLDDTIATLIEYDKISGPDGARAVRANQEEQRTALNEIIDQSQAKIDEYLDEKFEYEQEVRNFETEVGPIKYIAALAYEDPSTHYDGAVRAIILLLVFVFDPLAVLLLITANHVQMTNRSGEDNPDDDLWALFETDEIQNEENLRNMLNRTPPWEENDKEHTTQETEPLYHEILEDLVACSTEDDEDEEPETLPEPEPVDDTPTHELAGVDENTSLQELEIQPISVLESILDDLATRESIRPLDKKTNSRRNAIAHLIQKRRQRLAASTNVDSLNQAAPPNRLMDVNQNDKNIG